MKDSLIKQILKPVFFLILLTIVCGFLARTLVHSETLADHAAAKAEETYQEENAHIHEETDSSTDDDEKESAPEKTEGKNMPIISTAQEPETATSEGAADTTEYDSANDTSVVPDSRVVYQDGFYYEELTDEVKKKITGISYPVSAAEASNLAVPAINMLEDNVTPAVSYEDLRYLSVLYYDFNGEVQTGELICNKGIAQDFAEIFYELYQNEYQIEKIRLIDEYQGDDTASMADNNTSCFNYRVVDGTSSLSKHALGCAIDINPFYNPYVVFNRNGSGDTYISPPGSEIYADRSTNFPYKIDENDLCYKLFKEHGFTWGGDWNSCKDYQHFQKTL
ncbi:MAG: M15 family metallopeptidase [Bacillus sp. (in: Bacteria)]|nr:M15 family metallopeptidase [Bacillus sp. (in: firmicutes)]MCM1427953.1 M15 family metallopeptidase [Eubacterium sp.]